MSRISAVRSMTLTLTTSSRPRRCDGLSSPSQTTVSAPTAATTARRSCALPLPRNVAGTGGGAGGGHAGARVLRLAAAEKRRGVGVLASRQDAVEPHAARRLGERGELVQGVLGVLDGACGPQPGQHDALETQPPVLD